MTVIFLRLRIRGVTVQSTLLLFRVVTIAVALLLLMVLVAVLVIKGVARKILHRSREWWALSSLG